MKKIVVGILAHVDAGKTTLSESLLYLAGGIRKLGRVDHGDAYLDYNQQERNRGITIFSKQAMFSWNDVEITLIDTPGHVDFSAEMERTLSILDYAIVVINGLDGIQNHTETIWSLLKHYQIPTFVFMNKMDMPQVNQENLYHALQTLDDQCIDFTSLNEEAYEAIALTNETMLDEYLQNQSLSHMTLSQAILNRDVYPCYFGSALKMQGVKEFLDNITSYMIQPDYPQEFGAKVYKITREDGRLTHLKITGGTLQVKQMLNGEKVDQIRQYNGNKYQVVDRVEAGQVCAIKGPKTLQPHMGLGFESSNDSTMLSSYMNYHILLPDDCDRHTMIHNLQQLAEEDPELHLKFSHETGEITVQLMGEIQIEVLQNMVKERYGIDITFDQGQVVYKETIQDVVEGVGHFEPLRHYAEVHLLLEPLETGSGLQFATQCSTDILDRHWQRLIMTHLQEKQHLGVLTGSPITDMKITLMVGKAHLKHTEGGDFREATYRAIRQGLKKAQSQLLEPYYQYRLEIPHEYLSKAVFDIENKHGTLEISNQGDMAIIEGQAPVRHMQNYQNEVVHYSKGKGKLYCRMIGYLPCHESKQVIESMDYDSENDIQNPTGSIFCSHGAGFYVTWNDVEKHMHLPYQWKLLQQLSPNYQQKTYNGTDEELEDIFTKTYGPIKRRLSDDFTYHKEPQQVSQMVKPLPECLLVDGYNVIHSWSELKELANENLDVARNRLIDILGNYQGYRQCTLIIVFDAYKVKGNIGSVEHLHNVHIVYTKEAQTADMYIERTTHQLSQEYNVIVATSDALEQTIVIGRGARRMSSRELKLEVEALTKMKKEEFERKQEKSRNFLLEDIKNYQK